MTVQGWVGGVMAKGLDCSSEVNVFELKKKKMKRNKKKEINNKQKTTKISQSASSTER